MKLKKLNIGYKIWIEKDGLIFGLGPFYLLKNIQITSSLRKAAIDMRMSYRQAWGIIKSCEEKLGFDLLERQVGGAGGGYSLLTTEGEKFLYWFEQLHNEISKSIEEIFSKNYNKYYNQ
jgi:molybdate transport system regulatory protein